MKNHLLPLMFFLIPLISYSQSETVSLIITGGISDNTTKNNIEFSTSKLLSAINDAFVFQKSDLKLNESFITPGAIRKFKELWKEQSFYCKGSVIREPLVKNNQVYQIRNIPVVFDNDELLEFVLDYADDGRVSDFNLALEVHQYKSVLEATGVVDQTRREIILNFLENMRTAYMRKDVDFIEKLYSEKALIITGKVIKPIESNNDYVRSTFSRSQVEYQVVSKKEYISKLRSVFAQTPFLVLNFDSISVSRHKKFSNFYGVLLRQRWVTANYSDDGILFLLIQFNNEENPLIWVRTWQDAKETPKDEIFGFHNFKIISGGFVH